MRGIKYLVFSIWYLALRGQRQIVSRILDTKYYILNTLLLLLPLAAHALTPIDNPLTGRSAALPTAASLQARFIPLFTTFIGGFFLIAVIYGGFLWMTASGEAEKIDQGKKIITWATVGIIVLMAAYIIANFIIGALNKNGALISP